MARPRRVPLLVPLAALLLQSIACSAGSPASAAGAPLTSGIGACASLVTGTADVPTSPLPRPDYLQTVTDPEFGTQITRISGDWNGAIPNPTADPSLVGATWWAEAAGPLYAKDPAWNADETLLVVKKGMWGELFVDGSTYQPLFVRTRGSQIFSDWRWHPTNAQYAVYVTQAGEVGWWDPRADAVVPKIPAPGDLADCSIGGYEGALSNDGRFVPVQCTQGGAPVFFVADVGLAADAPAAKYPTIRSSDLGFSDLDWATISPLGTYVVASQDWTWTKSAPLSPGVRAADFKVGFASGHLDVGVAADGVTEVAYDAGVAQMFELATGARTELAPTGATQWHSSTRNVAPGATGWGFGSLESTSGNMRGELVAQELAPGGRVLRIAHHRTNLTSGSGGTEPSYEHAAFGSPSPDGLRVFFRSDWGDGWGQVHAYVVDVRSRCPPPAQPGAQTDGRALRTDRGG